MNQEVDSPSAISDVVPHPAIYEEVEQDAGYQELGETSRPSTYNQLERN